MIKLVTRILSVAIAAFSCWCFAYPQTPRLMLAGFIESREASSTLANRSEPTRDVTLAKTALAMLDAKISKSQGDGTASDLAKPDFDGAFFEAEPASFSDRLPAIRIPFLSSDSAPKIQPIDVGPPIQANPFLD